MKEATLTKETRPPTSDPAHTEDKESSKRPATASSKDEPVVERDPKTGINKDMPSDWRQQDFGDRYCR